MDLLFTIGSGPFITMMWMLPYTNTVQLGDAVYTATVTAKGPVAIERQVVKPSQLVGYEDPGEEAIYAKLATKKYQAAFVYRNDGKYKPQEYYAVAWDPQAKESLGLLRCGMMNTTDNGGLFFGDRSFTMLVRAYVPALYSSMGVMLDLETPNNMVYPLEALLGGAPLPYTIFDGYGAFGQKGENFWGGFRMAWVDKNLRKLLEDVLGNSLYVTRLYDAIAMGLPLEEDLKRLGLDDETIRRALKIVEDGLRVGVAGGNGFGKLAFDKKTGRMSISKIDGAAVVFDWNSEDVSYEVWNLYTGRSYTRSAAAARDLVAAIVAGNDDGGESDLDPLLVLDLVSKFLRPRGFHGYGTFSVKYNKSASQALSKIPVTDRDSRIATFLKGVKAPKYVGADDVMDLRWNYLKALFNGTDATPEGINFINNRIGNPNEYYWQQDHLKTMTASNVYEWTGRVLKIMNDPELNHLIISNAPGGKVGFSFRVAYGVTDVSFPRTFNDWTGEPLDYEPIVFDGWLTKDGRWTLAEEVSAYPDDDAMPTDFGSVWDEKTKTFSDIRIYGLDNMRKAFVDAMNRSRARGGLGGLSLSGSGLGDYEQQAMDSLPWWIYLRDNRIIPLRKDAEEAMALGIK